MKEKRLFEVIEYVSFYAVRHIPTGKEACMSDGVDALTTPTGKSMHPGSEYFRKTWERSLNANKEETLAAYFPDLPECTSSHSEECRHQEGKRTISEQAIIRLMGLQNTDCCCTSCHTDEEAGYDAYSEKELGKERITFLCCKMARLFDDWILKKNR